MLVGQDHVGGERSCWWERIMLVLQEEECRNVILHKENQLLNKTDPGVSVRNINCSKLYVVSPSTFSN